MTHDAPLLLVLGAGRHQSPLIQRAEARGIATVAVDYYEDSPGKRIASYAALADVLDADAVLAIADRFGVDGVATVGTDQAVVVLAHVADELGLPCHLDPVGALKATNKSAMRPALTEAGVVMPEAVTIRVDGPAVSLPELPCVVKAADSQGQRGMTIVSTSTDLERAIVRARAASRTSTVVVEHFHEGTELTINAWVEAGEIDEIAVLDRITFNPPPSIGICLRHVYPSLHVDRIGELGEIARRVASAYGVERGPLYIQAIVAPDGVKVVEAASRVGGGHEAQLLPRLTGLDLLDRTIDLALGQPVGGDGSTGAASGLVNFVVARPGTFVRMSAMNDLVDSGAIDEGGWYVAEGHDQRPIIDSMGRVGYFIVTSDGRASTLDRAEAAYRQLEVHDADGGQLVFWPSGDVMNPPSAN